MSLASARRDAHERLLRPHLLSGPRRQPSSACPTPGRPIDRPRGSPPPIRAWLRRAPLSLLLVVLVLAWLLPTLGLSLLIWLVIERALLWTQIARGKHKPRSSGSWLAKDDTPLKPGIEA